MGPEQITRQEQSVIPRIDSIVFAGHLAECSETVPPHSPNSNSSFFCNGFRLLASRLAWTTSFASPLTVVP